MTTAQTSPNLWLGERRGYLTDHLTQVWVRRTGRRVDWNEHRWLESPWLLTTQEADPVEGIAQRLGLNASPRPGSGLMESLSDLTSGDFDPGRVHPRIVAFYERTSDFSMDVWSRWSLGFRPFGWTLAWLYSRRLGQLNIPLDPLETSNGMTSEVVPFHDASGAFKCTLWRRWITGSERPVYLGFYSTATPPRVGQPCVHVAFPLPNGSATVLLRPIAHDDGSLELVSHGRRFGDCGFYFTLRGENANGHARYVRSATERIRVYVDDRNTLRAEHTFKWFGASVFELRYKLVEQDTQPATVSSAG